MRTFGDGNRAVKETREALGGQFGPDKNRKLVVELVRVADADCLVLWPKGTRQKILVDVKDVYRWALRVQASRAALERARAAKERKASRLAAAREVRWVARIKRENARAE